MNLIKKLVIGLLVLVVLLLILAFILPKEINVSVTKEVKAPSKIVYNYINDLTTQEEWNPWKEQDPTMELTFPGKTIGEGATYQWTSANSGSGSQLITSAVNNEKVVTEINFEGMGKGEATYTMVPNGDNTNVTWDFVSESSIPMNLFNFFAKRSLAKTFEKGISSIEAGTIKRFKNNEYDGYIIKEEMIEGKTYIINRAEVPSNNVNQYYTQNLPPLFQKIQELQLEMKGKPSMLFFNYNNNNAKMDMAAALPISENIAIADSDASIINMPTDKALVINYYGNYDNTSKAHDALSNYMSDRGLLKKYPLIQEFVTDSSKETDENKWLTRIIYFIAE